MTVQGVRLVRGGLTGAIYAVTKWKSDSKRGLDAWEAVEKFDVTDQFYRLVDSLAFPREVTPLTEGDDE